MKRTAILLAALALWCGAAAQQTQPPRFQGADAKRFMARLMGETEKLAIEKQIPASELSPQVVVAFTVDTAGRVDGWRFLDNTCQGRDKCDAEPATERTKQLVTEALGRLEAWTPARKDGLSVSYTWRLTMRLPVEKIAKRQEADPLLFMGGDPDETFHEWARVRLRYDERFSSRGVAGLVHVRFYIEPDGKVTIGEVLSSPDEKLSREVIRVIKASKGHWVPRRVKEHGSGRQGHKAGHIPVPAVVPEGIFPVSIRDLVGANAKVGHQKQLLPQSGKAEGKDSSLLFTCQPDHQKGQNHAGKGVYKAARYIPRHIGPV